MNDRIKTAPSEPPCGLNMRPYVYRDPRTIPPRATRSLPIEYDKTPVQCRHEPLDEPLWIGRQWAVTTFGIERRDGGYTIGKERLFEGMPNHSWVGQAKTSGGVDAEDLATAFMVALVLHGGAKVEGKKLSEIVLDQFEGCGS